MIIEGMHYNPECNCKNCKMVTKRKPMPQSKENDIMIKKFHCSKHGYVKPNYELSCPDCHTSTPTPTPTTPKEIDELREKLADIEHQRWSDWQKYLHSKCFTADHNTDGLVCWCNPQIEMMPNLNNVILHKEHLVIPEESVKHWERQINTPYAELSEVEKDSDRKQVDRYIDLIKTFFHQKYAELLESVIPEEYSVLPDLPSLQFREGYNQAIQEIKSRIKKVIS